MVYGSQFKRTGMQAGSQLNYCHVLWKQSAENLRATGLWGKSTYWKYRFKEMFR